MNTLTSIGDRVDLNNGTRMPWLGLGVYQMTDEETRQACLLALDAGYRSLDTASVYKNEAGVGQALRETDIPREDLFVTTKLWNDDQRAGRTMSAFQESLDRLETDYVDLYLVHWPVRGHIVGTWKAMEDILASGRAKAIGVSNFLPHHLDELLVAAEVVPAINQVEFHPHLVQPNLLSYCKAQGIVVEAWSPLMQGQVASEKTIAALAEKYGKTPAQIVLRWDLQHGVVTIPKSTRKSRIEENAGIFDFELSEEDMGVLNDLDETRRLGPDPDTFAF
ncbi:aldo/keto reductase [Labrenzia sp. 011]|uniref:aldo/keto reductase n=1 Tax=Labrenzia sp. 011 TaxID=2171494 RepID=UPI000D514FBE|nr:aldo/keto reductase [Labrenzia sp. 011]PVB63706.1 aldo/keto reductase [Labrenzia sp. 011]